MAFDSNFVWGYEIIFPDPLHKKAFSKKKIFVLLNAFDSVDQPAVLIVCSKLQLQI